MHIKKHLKSELTLFCFQLKNVKLTLLVPGVLLFILLPFILILTMKKYGDISYVQENFILMTQYLIPILSVWSPAFAFISLIESDSDEIHYVNHKMKDNLIIFWLIFYLVVIAVICLIASIWIDNLLLEYIRLLISSCFYTSLLYCLMYISNSMTATFLGIILYWLSSTFGGQIPLDQLNCYDTRAMTMQLLAEKYVYLMLAAIILYLIGYWRNRKKEKYS